MSERRLWVVEILSAQGTWHPWPRGSAHTESEAAEDARLISAGGEVEARPVCYVPREDTP